MALKIDFGSGHNPKEGYKRCDMTCGPNLDFVYDAEEYKILDCADESVDEIWCRNVLHHIPDLKRLFNEFRRVLKVGGSITIVEPTKEAFDANICKDYLWYRFIIPRYDVWYATEYRDYAEDLEKIVGPRTYNDKTEEYETMIFQKENKNVS